MQGWNGVANGSLAVGLGVAEAGLFCCQNSGIVHSLLVQSDQPRPVQRGPFRHDTLTMCPLGLKMSI